ncbi:MAG TPA: hypothetical protein VNA14_01375 [Mycobacteriales bacterium]|nr:hypothetical protein [Mycobacteriales bacterium]
MSDLDRAAAAAQAAGKNIGGPGVRELGVVSLTTPDAAPAAIDSGLSERARDLLRDEVERMTAARAEFVDEQAHGAPGRLSGRLDAMAASLEGATRFALRLGLLTPGDAREIWTAARAAGVRDDDPGSPAAPPQDRPTEGSA